MKLAVLPGLKLCSRSALELELKRFQFGDVESSATLDSFKRASDKTRKWLGAGFYILRYQ